MAYTNDDGDMFDFGFGSVKKVTGGNEFRSKKRKVLRSFKIRPEWKSDLDEMMKAGDEAKAYVEKMAPLIQRLDALRNRFWARVELDMNEFGKMFRYNDKTNEIDELEPSEDDE